MKRNLTFLSLMAIAILSGTCAIAQQNTTRSSNDDDSFGDFVDNPGVWSAVIHGDKTHIQFGGFHWNSGTSFMTSELGPLPIDKPGTFVVKRDAGTVTFTGTFSNDRGHGTYTYTEDASFKDYLTQAGFRDITEELMLHLFFTNIDKKYFAYMKENGYEGITMSELKDLAYQDVNYDILSRYLELFKKEGFGKVSVDQIVELREHGVSPGFIGNLHELGYKTLSLDKAQELVDHGVSIAFIRELQSMGYNNISLDNAQELVDHGVSADFIREFHQMGYKDMTPETARELVDHGVSVQFVREFQHLGYKDISLDRATELADHGVKPSFVSRFKELGFVDISLRKAEELADHGVTTEFIKKMQDKGLKNLSLDEYIRLADAGM
jgi:hypothetical protein